MRFLVALKYETLKSFDGSAGVVLSDVLLAPQQDERTDLNKGKCCSFSKCLPCHHTTSGHILCLHHSYASAFVWIH